MKLKLTLSILVALALVTAGTAQAAPVPTSAKVVDVTLTYAPPVTKKPVHRAFTGHNQVSAVVEAIDALPPARSRGVMCPMILMLGPTLTVVFRAGPAGPALAEARVHVALGTHGSSGSSVCSPISYWIRDRQQTPLLGNSFVRMVGRLIGVKIS
jgi:hypothetical protein